MHLKEQFLLTTFSSKKPWSSVLCCPNNLSVSRSVSGSSAIKIASRNKNFTPTCKQYGYIDINVQEPTFFATVSFTLLRHSCYVTIRSSTSPSPKAQHNLHIYQHPNKNVSISILSKCPIYE